MEINLFSFGFKHGHPEADCVIDVRFLPNPYWIAELKEHTGLEEPVAAYVLESAVGKKFLQQLDTFLTVMVQSHQEAERQKLRCAIGCTGGRHRSVAVTEHLRRVFTSLLQADDQLSVWHRDIDKL
jgi:UPF0042 nucleotide-binding protein